MKRIAAWFLALISLLPVTSTTTKAALVKLGPADDISATAAMESALARFFARPVRSASDKKLEARYRAILADTKLQPAERRSELFDVLEQVSGRLSGSSQDLVLVKPEEMPRFLDDGDTARLKEAVDRSLADLKRRTTDTLPFGSRGVRRSDLIATLEEFQGLLAQKLSPEQLDGLVRSHFDIYRSPGKNGSGGVLYTAYNDPVFEGSFTPDATFRFPLYRPPETAKIANGRYDRREIDRGALAKKGLELVWLKHPAEAYLLELEGSGLVKLPDGRMMRVRYAADNGRKYASLGHDVEKDGLLTPVEIALAQGRTLYATRPDLALGALEKNPRAIFFAGEVMASATGELDLLPRRSVAVDTSFFPRHGLGFMWLDRPSEFTAANKKPSSYRPVSRFLVNQDAGAAIHGPGRIDIYWGHDQDAQLAAGQLRQPGSLCYLLRKGTSLTEAPKNQVVIVQAAQATPKPAAKMQLARASGKSRSPGRSRAPSSLRPHSSGSTRRRQG